MNDLIPIIAAIDRPIDVELKASLSREPNPSTRFDVLVSIPGIAEITAIACSSENAQTQYPRQQAGRIGGRMRTNHP